MLNKDNNWRCNACREFYIKGKAHYCYECDYDICENCITKTINTTKNYGHPHRLILYNAENGYSCDNCHVFGDHSKTRFRCINNECDFDLCLNCHYSDYVH